MSEHAEDEDVAALLARIAVAERQRLEAERSAAESDHLRLEEGTQPIRPRLTTVSAHVESA